MSARRAGVLVYAGGVVLLALSVAAVALTSNLVVAAVMIILLSGILGLLVLGIERLAIATLVMAFATAPIYRGIAGITGGVATPTDILLVIAAGLLVPVVMNRNLELPTAYVVGVLLVALFGLVATVLSDEPGGSLYGLIRWLFFLGIVPILIAWWRPDPKVVSLLLWSYVAVHVLSTLDAIAEGPTVGNRYQGLTHHTNAFGMAGLTALAILLYLVHRHRGTVARSAAAFAGLMSVLSIVMSGSRSALAVAVVLVMLVPIVERTAVSSVVLAGALLVGALAFPLLLHSGDGGSAFARLAGDPTAAVADNARSGALELGIQRYWESPIFGDGLANVEYYHNVFLEAAIGAGIAGLVGFLFVLYTLVRPLLSEHVFRRLGYLPLIYIGMGPANPGIWEETMWVPVTVSILAALGTVTYVRGQDVDPGVDPDANPDADPDAATEVVPATRPVLRSV